jgi:uncharacterized protein
MITQELIRAIIDQHNLKGVNSIHFIDHWARVFENGRRLAAVSGARLDVVELFAVFHDAGRVSDGKDPEHGERGAIVAASMRGYLFDLDPEGWHLLRLACQLHSKGQLQGDLTVQTCWDSDRLDLLRAGFYPAPERLCTPAARTSEIIAWANQRSASRYIPADVYVEWGFETG